MLENTQLALLSKTVVLNMARMCGIGFKIKHTKDMLVFSPVKT